MNPNIMLNELKETFALDLAGSTISLKEASQKYHISMGTISHWLTQGLIEIVEPAKRRGMAAKLSERDIAIMVQLNSAYRAEGNKRGPLKGWNK